MPIPMELNKTSSDDEIEAQISRCIRFLRREGREGEQAAGICYDEARKKTGKALGKR